ncbi:MAG: response regulator [Clostridiales Family XIII bacterium]|jgi:signal transduction histidine kinase/DNA-binding response OmpR family regulator/HPt (histidine-containing phosphotransfer) domain-containing protein|nr:response regulator [Clostridiales Family XIII bacterium]
MKLRSLIKTNIMQLLFVVVAFMLMIIISCVFMASIVRTEVSVAAQEMLLRTETMANSMLRELEVTTLNLSLAIQDRLDSGQPASQIEPYMRTLSREMVYHDKRVPGSMFLGGLIEGQFHAGAKWTPPADYRPEDRPWYKAARAAGGDVAFCGPFASARTGGRVVAFSRDLRGGGGANYGVVFLDMDIDGLCDAIASLDFNNGGYGMIIDADGAVIAHSERSFEGKALSAAGEGYATISERIRAGDERISASSVVNFQGERVVSIFQRMPNGWYVGIAFPWSSYYKDVYVMVATLTAIGLAMMLVLCYLLLRLSMQKLHSEQESLSKSSFLAKMSHEIRTPLNSILGMSELILRKEVPREIFEYVAIIRQAGSNLLAIVNDILDFSKIEAGQLDIVYERYYFASLLNDIVNVIRVRLLDRPIVFSIKADCGIPDCLIGDETRVRQVLMNLLGNAVKYTKAGHILLDVRAEGTEDDAVRLSFRIEDSGVGIRESDMGRLFMDFTRIGPPQGQDVEGTGLGLVISRSLCRSMGGDISVESEYGKGSVFTATVVQTRGAAKRLASVENAEEKRVLVFEERPIQREALVYALESLGVKPVCAKDAAEFSGMMSEGGFDFAFTDSKHGADCRFSLGKGESPTMLVSMVELGEVSAYRDAHSIMMPVFCTGVANVLNNVANPAPHSLHDHRTGFSAPGVKVLIVDDISTNLRVSKELMSLYGMEIHTCLSGAEAIKLARENRYDLIFMDHMMPEMDGLEASAAIRATDGDDPYYASVPIIALTANAMAGQRETFLQSGMNGFLAKPIEMNKLDALLKEWIPMNMRVSANGGPAPAGAERLGFFEIKGVSIEKGLRNSGGSVAAYADILMDFCRDADERLESVERCVAEGDMGLYLTLVHALKGAARSVGAEEFAELAARLEEAAQNGETEAVEHMTGSMLAALNALTYNIREALEERSGGGDGAFDELSAARLESLRTALAGMDIATVNALMLECSSLSLSPDARREMSEIERLILIFEYDAAIERIGLLIDASKMEGA